MIWFVVFSAYLTFVHINEKYITIINESWNTKVTVSNKLFILFYPNDCKMPSQNRYVMCIYIKDNYERSKSIYYHIKHWLFRYFHIRSTINFAYSLYLKYLTCDSIS